MALGPNTIVVGDLDFLGFICTTVDDRNPDFSHLYASSKSTPPKKAMFPTVDATNTS